MNHLLKFNCPKCGNKQYETGEMWTVGSIWTRMFEFHNRRFTFVTCQKCRYTELFKVPQKNIGDTYNNLAR
ncbi:MAG: GTP-binding protein [Odoribacter sp.]|nr:GTP-binding protein [Odoribacter sp.]